MNPPHWLNDGAHYDARHATVVEDIPFWVEWATHSPGPILELGCGTGPVLHPMALTGKDVWGIDSSVAFLKRASTKGTRPHLIEGDMRAFRLDQRFGLVCMPFRTVAHLLHYPEMRDCFRRAREHLLSSGTFIIDAYNSPDSAQSRSARFVAQYMNPSGESIRYNIESQYDSGTRIVSMRVTFEPKVTRPFLGVIAATPPSQRRNDLGTRG